ncbi:MAG: hypothetical protein MPW17_16830 [Candidatus Manganitrophus sp.]|nr:hypothetical protein [Candidatus Manganitrophus sp.]MDC4224299.1 hypothetical protein [Candidatus Manganitrophus sp.]WDT70404.1 MAG: hypothetical protein MPW17_16830 [Candidatus Manganitrophus sp.]WDT77333.1 MAG: hypothetical protein MPW16_08965 [Candidatus Manganitrophus sp.]
MHEHRGEDLFFFRKNCAERSTLSLPDAEAGARRGFTPGRCRAWVETVNFCLLARPTKTPFAPIALIRMMRQRYLNALAASSFLPHASPLLLWLSLHFFLTPSLGFSRIFLGFRNLEFAR